MAEPDELSTTEAALSPCVLDAGVRAFEEFIAAADSEFVVRQIYAAMRAAEAEMLARSRRPDAIGEAETLRRIMDVKRNKYKIT